MQTLNVYGEAARCVTKQIYAWRLESKTKQFPFVVACDLDPSLQKKIIRPDPFDIDDDDEEGHAANRHFLVFHDFQHYLCQRANYPNCHEIVRCPSKRRDKLNEAFDNGDVNPGMKVDEAHQKFISGDEESRGRLIFDFDLESPLPSQQYLNTRVGVNVTIITDASLFVPTDFKEQIEGLICNTFTSYWKNVDIDKLVFIWQITRHPNKFSMHLIVKNAYFCEYWINQIRLFYILMQRIAADQGLDELMTTIDFAMARRNATFRMLECSKIGGRPIVMDSIRHLGIDRLHDQAWLNENQMTIEDCYVGLYDVHRLRREQSIAMEDVDYVELESSLSELKDSTNKRDLAFIRTVQQSVTLDLDIDDGVEFDDEATNTAIDIFEKTNYGVFTIRGQAGNFISLNRAKPAPCLLSGRIHEHENAYLKMHKDGHLHFYCHRGCKGEFGFSLDLGSFLPREPTRPMRTEIDADGHVVNLGPQKRQAGDFIPFNQKKLLGMLDLLSKVKTVVVDVKPEKQTKATKAKTIAKEKAAGRTPQVVTVTTNNIIIPLCLVSKGKSVGAF